MPWVLRVVKTHFSATGQTYSSLCPPALFANGPTGDILILQHFHLWAFRSSAHESKALLRASRVSSAASFRRMHRGFRGRERENDDVFGVRPIQSQNIPEEISVGFRVGTKKQDVCTVDHARSLPPTIRVENIEVEDRQLSISLELERH